MLPALTDINNPRKSCNNSSSHAININTIAKTSINLNSEIIEQE